MNMSDRRRQILEVLLLRRHDTYDNLAQEFNVSKMTIRRDIAALTCSYPIETVRGRYCGGVKVKDGYYPYKSSLNTTQIECLNRIKAQLNDEDKVTVNSILEQFAP